MRIFSNCKEALSEISRDLSEMGAIVKTKTMQDINIEDNCDFLTKEIQAYSFCILNDFDKDEIVKENLEWCKAEFRERTSNYPLNPGVAWKLREKVWKEFITGNKFGYTYSERMNKQVNDAIGLLKRDLNSRQCVIQVYDKNIDNNNRMGKVRIPCSIFYQLMFRNNALDIIYVMRSCDRFTHFANDIWLACELKSYIADKIGVKSGKFFMFISSLHGYKKDMEGVF